MRPQTYLCVGAAQCEFAIMYVRHVDMLVFTDIRAAHFPCHAVAHVRSCNDFICDLRHHPFTHDPKHPMTCFPSMMTSNARPPIQCHPRAEKHPCTKPQWTTLTPETTPTHAYRTSLRASSRRTARICRRRSQTAQRHAEQSCRARHRSATTAAVAGPRRAQ